MEKLDIFNILEQCDRKLHAKIVHSSLHPLYPQIRKLLLLLVAVVVVVVVIVVVVVVVVVVVIVIVVVVVVVVVVVLLEHCISIV